MKTKNILFVALIVLLAGMGSCQKDHDIPTGKVFNGGSGGGSTTDSLTISVTADPSEGGTVSGGGKYLKGKTCVVAASANEGYVFSNWTENGTQVSTSVSYSFTVDADRTLVANFSVSTGNNFTITAVASPEYGGVISGSGTYQQGQTCTLTATAEAGYTFVNWTENGSQVSTEASYTFTVTGNRTLVANFTLCDYTSIILNEINGNDKFIEIYNSGTVAINLNGVYLEKDGIPSWVADNTLRIEAGDYLLLYSEDVQFDHPDWPEALIFHIGLSAKKNIHVQLFAPAGVSIGDFNLTNIDLNGEAYGYANNQAPASYSRNTDGNWYYAEATPGGANIEGANLVLGLEGGETPPNPGTEIFSESFANGQGTFTIQDVFVPQELSYVWKHDSQYSCMKAAAFSGQYYVTESWLVSPIINLSGVSSAKLTFSQAVNYVSPQGALFMMISTNYDGNVNNATWTELNLDQWPAGNNWTFISSTADLTPYVGQTVTIAFKYTSSTNSSATWEVKDFVVE